MYHFKENSETSVHSSSVSCLPISPYHGLPLHSLEGVWREPSGGGGYCQLMHYMYMTKLYLCYLRGTNLNAIMVLGINMIMWYMNNDYSHVNSLPLYNSKQHRTDGKSK